MILLHHGAYDAVLSDLKFESITLSNLSCLYYVEIAEQAKIKRRVVHHYWAMVCCILHVFYPTLSKKIREVGNHLASQQGPL